jgi:hypothetical protein
MCTENVGAPWLLSGLETVEVAVATLSVPLLAVDGMLFSLRSCWVSVMAVDVPVPPTAWKVTHTTSPDPDSGVALNIEMASVPGDGTLSMSSHELVYAVVVTTVGVTTAGSYVTVASREMTPSAGFTEMGTTASPPGGTNSGDGTLTTLVARAGSPTRTPGPGTGASPTSS